MTLYGCKNCGAVMVETSSLSIGEKKQKDDGDTVVTEYYIEGGVCPGCGGRGCPVEEVSQAERNN